MAEAVLEVEDLHTYFFNRRGVLKAVDGVSFTLYRGETLGLVGESGCGKSMTALSIVRLVPRPAARIVRGQVRLRGEDLLAKSEREMRQVRGRRIAMILQDPQASLNPVFTIGNQLVEAFAVQRRWPRRRLWTLAAEALRHVKVPEAARRLYDFPHQLSGGMKQRVVGAIALAGAPEVLIADEPTTALDVTIQLQFLRLLKELQAETQMAMLFITHDFGIVARLCDRVAVMYAGRIVEQGPVRAVFRQPAHPYTQALMASVPRLDVKVDTLATIEGQPPALDALPEGCRFAPRCPYVERRCQQAYPPMVPLQADHAAACWRLEG
ncbi:MAG: dipeptide/oligopeptide/nickel ABC transporter ATP-binding protein [Candidatus Tectimicrobiota bacterium]|nr:MAG: dipeptide/oligopeptide/nickel ABC transporter ATP-binding protein [Candidatus Tectomicrobia bacterium]